MCSIITLLALSPADDEQHDGRNYCKEQYITP